MSRKSVHQVFQWTHILSENFTELDIPSTRNSIGNKIFKYVNFFSRPKERTTFWMFWRSWPPTSSTSRSLSPWTPLPQSPNRLPRSASASPTCWATLLARWTSLSSRPWGRATEPSFWPTARWHQLPEKDSTRSTCWQPSQVSFYSNHSNCIIENEITFLISLSLN